MQENAQAETIFGNAVEIDSVAAREAYLAEACRDDPALRKEVAKLLQDYFRSKGFLENPVAQINPP